MENIKNDVINLLTENARYSFKEIAMILGVDEDTVCSVVSGLEKDGVIVKYAAILNAEALTEKKVNALIEVKVAPQQLKGFDSCAEEIYNFWRIRNDGVWPSCISRCSNRRA